MSTNAAAPGSSVDLASPLQGTVVQVAADIGGSVGLGTLVVVLESMKMEHEVRSPVAGTLVRVIVAVGDLVAAGDIVATVEAGDASNEIDVEVDAGDLDAIRPDLAEVLARRAGLDDDARPEAVARRRQRERWTARESIAALVDPGSFAEYGGLVIAAQRRRRSVDELIAETPADGLIAGTARINGDRFDDALARCAVVSYDYMVLAGTQGQQNHRKKDRLFSLAERLRLPVVLFAEGGGGRPGDTDFAVVTGLDTEAFAHFARLSGLVPLVGIASGRCFAGNAALLGCCDVIIATEGTSIGMGGPAMIEGGGLGSYRPEEVGPLDVQVAGGVVDLVAADDGEAVALAKAYLSYFQGPVDAWSCADQRMLRSAIPEQRLRAYDMGALLETLVDEDSLLELRRGFAPGMRTALGRIEGRPVGIVANDPTHLGGAIDSDGADKAARFMQLCEAHGLPIVFVCDTPGFMVGPEAEATGQVRHVSRMFVAGAALTVPFCTVVVRKAYGLGAQAMAGGSFRSPLAVISWPSGELGGMGLEGAVRLGFRRELDAIEDPVEREALFASMVEMAYEHGKALNVASSFEIDDVIDPADTRVRIVEILRAAPATAPRSGRRGFIDTW